MERNNNHGVGCSIALTLLFVLMAVGSYVGSGVDSSFGITCALVVVGVIMTIYKAVKASNLRTQQKQQQKLQQNAEKAIKHDRSIGSGNMKLYIDSSSNKVTICVTTSTESKQEEVKDFVCSKAVETALYYIVAVDSSNHKILKVRYNKGRIIKTIFNLDDELKALGITINKCSLSLKAYGDYAFITDDVNEFIVIVKPAIIQVLRYTDIVSISYEENGNNVYNKSLGGAVAGGLLFGGVGAIVGSNTEKVTQNREVSSMSIKILLKSTSNSTIFLTIYNGAPLKTKEIEDRMLYEKLKKEAIGIKDIFSIIIDITDKHSSQVVTNQTTSMSKAGSIADELTKLAKLKDSGILSEEEFNAQKSKLLNR